VEFTWADGAIADRMLRVTVLPTARSHLADADVFYFGSLVGETGDGHAPNLKLARVDGYDAIAIRAAMSATAAPVDSRFDLNHDGRVNSADLAIARAHQGQALSLYGAPLPPPPAAQAPAAVVAFALPLPIAARAGARRRPAYLPDSAQNVLR